MILIALLVAFQISFEVYGIKLIPLPNALITNVDEVQAQHRTKQDHQMKSNISVISHEFPLTDDNLSSKPAKEEIHTFDPKASFPHSFTICSTMMTTSATKSSTSHFFSILGKGGKNYLNAFLAGGLDSVGLHTKLFNFKAKGKISRVFPDQWLTTCLALNTHSGLLQWVLEAQLVANVSLEAIRQNTPEHPADLSGKLLLGARKRGRESWSVHSNKVTLLNICSIDSQTVLLIANHFYRQPTSSINI